MRIVSECWRESIFAASLARPGGNVTGSTFQTPELRVKRIELMKEAIPRIVHVALLVHADNPSSDAEVQAAREGGAVLKVELHHFQARKREEFEGVFAAMAKRRIDAVLIAQDATFNANAAEIARLATTLRIASAGGADYAVAGGLIRYGPDTLALVRRAGYFVDRILKGAKPGDLPVEQATKFEVVINLKTAKALGITIHSQSGFAPIG